MSSSRHEAGRPATWAQEQSWHYVIPTSLPSIRLLRTPGPERPTGVDRPRSRRGLGCGVRSMLASQAISTRLHRLSADGPRPDFARRPVRDERSCCAGLAARPAVDELGGGSGAYDAGMRRVAADATTSFRSWPCFRSECDRRGRVERPGIRTKAPPRPEPASFPDCPAASLSWRVPPFPTAPLLRPAAGLSYRAGPYRSESLPCTALRNASSKPCNGPWKAALIVVFQTWSRIASSRSSRLALRQVPERSRESDVSSSSSISSV